MRRFEESQAAVLVIGDLSDREFNLDKVTVMTCSHEHGLLAKLDPSLIGPKDALDDGPGFRRSVVAHEGTPIQEQIIEIEEARTALVGSEISEEFADDVEVGFTPRVLQWDQLAQRALGIDASGVDVYEGGRPREPDRGPRQGVITPEQVHHISPRAPSSASRIRTIMLELILLAVYMAYPACGYAVVEEEMLMMRPRL